LFIFASFLSLNPNRNRQHGKHIIATKFTPADGWIRAIIPTVNQPILPARSGEPAA
jgi:hypothetical protein